MATTHIKQLVNEVSNKLMFVKLEDTGNNRYALSGTETNPSFVDVGNCTVPHCDTEDEFLKKTIIITNMDNAKVIAYIWQHKSKDGDAVRYSTNGWSENGNKLRGYSNVGGNINITVNPDGTIEGDKL